MKFENEITSYRYKPVFVFLIQKKESLEFGGTTQSEEELPKLEAWQNYNF